MSDVLLRTTALRSYFPARRALFGRHNEFVRAVDGVDLEVARGETVGIVGESGSGKSTLGRTLVRLIEPTDGSVHFDGRDITHVGGHELRQLRRSLQIVFQDPVSSLNPRRRVGDIVGDGLAVHGIGSARERRVQVQEILGRVGIESEAMERYPHEFSGGQRQRIGIARALVLGPRLLVADEPVSALDVSIQAQVLNLLVRLKEEFELTYVFIAHNLAVVSYIADRIAVMYLGKLVEIAPASRIYAEPLHPYTAALASAVPGGQSGQLARRIRLEGDVPSPINPPSGCRFRTRCPIAREICAAVEPPLVTTADGRRVACHFAGHIPLATQSLQPPTGVVVAR